MRIRRSSLSTSNWSASSRPVVSVTLRNRKSVLLKKSTTFKFQVMKRIFGAIAGFALLLCSCSEISEQDVQDRASYFTAELEPVGTSTRTYLDEYYSVVWNNGDYLDVFEKSSAPVRYRFSGADGSTGGALTRDPENTDAVAGDAVSRYYAVFPHENAGMDSQEKIIATIHDEQTYSEYSFGPTDNLMVAASTGTSFSFKNVGGWVVLKLYGEGAVSKITLKGNANEIIAGRVKISFDENGIPTTEPQPRQSGLWRREIALSFPAGPVALGPTKDEATEFWFMLRPVELPSGLTFVVTDPSGRTFEKAVPKSYTVNRNESFALRTQVVFTTSVSSVSLAPAEATLAVGETKTLVATVLPENATDKTVTWTSSDATVATVDESGKVTALKVGSATITAKAGEKTATCAITVIPVGVTGVTLDKEELSLKPGESSALTAAVLPENAADKSVTWSSSDTGVATVDANGKVTAKSVGTATVTVTTTDGGKKATCAVNVSPIEVSSVSLNKTELSLLVGGTETLTATVSPSNATDKSVTWSTSDATVATVDESGKVTALKVGTATITAKAGAKSTQCAVTVNPVSVTGVSLNKTSTTLAIGGSETLTATVSPANATNKSVTWKSSNTSVATVDSNGKVTAVKDGSATITVTTVDGSKTATCAVTVNPISITSIALDKASLSMTKGGTATLVATITPSNATYQTVTWTSSSTSVATVDSNGKVTAVGGGSATITATAGGKSATCAVAVTVPVTGVSLNKTSLSLAKGSTQTLTATITPSDATNKNVTWTSSNTSVATVDASGKVTAVASGNATITVKTVDGGKTAACSVTVTVPVTGVSLNMSSLSLTKGSTETLMATINPSDATNKSVTWTSSNTSVATVDSNGKVTAEAGGSATITVKTADGNKTATCSVTVTVPVTGVSLNKTSLSLAKGSTETLIATITPSDATNQSVTWTSSNTSVATVDSNGKVTAEAGGSATITVKTADGNKTATCAVTVTVPVTGVNLNKTSLSLRMGSTQTLTATITPSDATNKSVTWTSSNTSVATVDSNGKVTAVGGGSATITVKTADGNKTATCTVTVSVPVTGVSLNKTSMSLTKGSTQTLTATITPSDATNKNVTWTSSNTSVATVDASGKVTAVGGGSATITVKTVDGNKTATCTVTVTVAVTGVTLNKSAITLPIGGTETLIHSILPSDATNQSVTWSTSSSAIATVSNGTVTAKAKGTATITVRTSNGYTASCAVTVDASENTRNDYTYSSGGWED